MIRSSYLPGHGHVGFGFACVLIAAMLSTSGLAQHPKDRAAWAKQIEAALEAGKDKEALSHLAAAAKAIADDTDFQSPAAWFKRLGDRRIKEQAWEAGLTVSERALKVLPADEKNTILSWRSNLFRHWSQALLDKKDIDGSLKVLARAYALDPDDTQIASGITYHTQEALRHADAKSLAAVIEQYQALGKRFPNVEGIAQRGRLYTARAIGKMVEEQKFKDALSAIDRYRPLLAKPAYGAEMGSLVYDGWARNLASKKQWQAALDKYAEGLKASPGQDRLMENAIATVDAWAEPAINAKNWDEAIRVYTIGLKYFPDSQHLRNNKEVCEKKKERGK